MADVIKRIHSKGPIIQEEYIAGEAGIYPGMLLELNSSGQVIKHNSAGGAYGDEVLIAAEDQLLGKNVDTVYTSGEMVTCFIVPPGSEVNMLLDDGTTVAIGGHVISTGDGTIKPTTSTPLSNVGVATKALDLSATANLVNGLVPVRVVG